ncbi:MAG: hypothetical protein NTX75_10605 [Proteobacteria bacterium]|nr:hypothetical protein [Pseudomonadota bacterium]
MFWLSERDKYEITSWAFSYFMTSNLSVEYSVLKAIKKVRPDKIKKDGLTRLSNSTLIELQMRVKNML